jgi:HK97 family phage prohead protease
MEREYRIQKNAIRAKKGEKPGIEGHAAVFNQLSVDLGWFRERIMPGAFTANLKASPDVRCLFNHDPNLILGRTTAGTLRLKEDDKGLFYDCDTPDTQTARDLQTSIERGDVDQCSFGFMVRKQKWSEEPDPDDPTGKSMMNVREVHDAELFDVSPVTYPAYTGTDVSKRMNTLFPDGVPAEVRSHVPKLDEEIKRAAADCECDCTRCQRDDCENCTNKECDDENCEGCPMQEGDRSAVPVTAEERERLQAILDHAAIF